MNPVYTGNVHEVYELSPNKLALVATDHLSVHGSVIPWEIKDKGCMLTQISNFWFANTKDIVENHLIETDTESMPAYFQQDMFRGRTVIVERLKILPYEFIVRGYMFGRLWKAYQKNEKLCGCDYGNKEYLFGERLDAPILTPTIKLDHSRDRDADINHVKRELGHARFEEIKEICIQLYQRCYDYMEKKGFILADTKFEFGMSEDNRIVLADEIFTPDSSRFWKASEYEVGHIPMSYDKQLIRDWLSNNKCHGKYQYEKIPTELIARTEAIYREFYNALLL